MVVFGPCFLLFVLLWGSGRAQAFENRKFLISEASRRPAEHLIENLGQFQAEKPGFRVELLPRK